MIRGAGEQPGRVARNDGNADQALAGPRAFERQDQAPFLAHACMEPMNCTADVRADGCDVYVPTQGQTASHQAAIGASGMPADKVNIHTTYMGGGFGRRGEADFVIDAVETSKAVVTGQVVWSREHDIHHDYYRRPPMRAWGRPGRDWGADGVQATADRAVADEARRRPAPNGADFISLDGAANLPYPIPNVSVEYKGRTRAPVRLWPLVGALFQGFVVEAFVDELAVDGRKELTRISFGATRWGKSIRGSRRRSNWARRRPAWSTPLAMWRGRGPSSTERFCSICVEVSEVSSIRRAPAKGAQGRLLGRLRLGDQLGYDQGSYGRAASSMAWMRH